MSFRFALIAALLAVAPFASSQNFRQGFIRLQGGQDQVGLIGKVVEDFSQGIEYKASDSSDVTVYRAEDIEGYGVGNTYYTSFQDPSINRRFFVVLLVDGELTLIRRYSMYFLVDRKTKTVEQLGKAYARTLRHMTRGCPWVASKASRVRRNDVDLSAHIIEYNYCVATKNPNRDGMPKAVSIAVMAGTDYSTLTFSEQPDNETRYLSAGKLNDKALPQVGVDFTFRDYNRSNLVGLYLGLFYNSNRYAELRRVYYGTRSDINEFTIDIKELKIPLGIELIPPTNGNVSCHLRIGAVFRPSISMRSTHPTYEIDWTSTGTIYNEQPGNVSSFKARPQGMAALGLDYRLQNDSRIRLQFGSSYGSVKATVLTGAKKTDTGGNYLSINVMAGFIF